MYYHVKAEAQDKNCDNENKDKQIVLPNYCYL